MLRKMLSATILAVAALSATHPASAQDKNILMVLWRGETESEITFKSKLKELGVNANFVEINGNQDRGNIANLMREKEPDVKGGKFQLIYSHGTTASQVAQTVVGDSVPMIFNIVYDPVAAKLVTSAEKPGGNVTGVTNGVAIERQFDAFEKLSPLKKIILLFNAREANSNNNEKAVTTWAEKNKIEISSQRVAPGDESLDRVLADIKSGKLTGDAIYAGADSYLSTQAEKIKAAVGDKLLLLGGTQTFVLRGWLAAYAPTVEDMGVSAAELAAKILKGSKPGDNAVVQTKPVLILSKATADQFKIAIPAGAKLEK